MHSFQLVFFFMSMNTYEMPDIWGTELKATLTTHSNNTKEKKIKSNSSVTQLSHYIMTTVPTSPQKSAIPVTPRFASVSTSSDSRGPERGEQVNINPWELHSHGNAAAPPGHGHGQTRKQPPFSGFPADSEKRICKSQPAK